jgi:hypothetical protein
VSAAAQKVMVAFAGVMQELATTDTDEWDTAEVIGFADGIAIINDVMAQAKATLLERQGVSDGQGQ